MDRNQVRVALLKITTVTLLVSTWVFWSFVFATRPELADAPAAPESALTNLVRLPASLPATLPEKLVPVFGPGARGANPPIEMSAFPVACWDRHDRAIKDTSSRWIRLTGRACQAALNAQEVTVRNLSNGYVATVFAPSKGGDMTTDFIPLQTGKNDVLIRFESETGVALESQFTFLRE